MFVSVFDIYEL